MGAAAASDDSSNAAGSANATRSAVTSASGTGGGGAGSQPPLSTRVTAVKRLLDCNAACPWSSNFSCYFGKNMRSVFLEFVIVLTTIMRHHA